MKQYNTIVIRSADADGTRPIALNGEVIGNVAPGEYDWHVNYIRPDNGLETWCVASSLAEVKVKLHSIYGLAPPARRRAKGGTPWLRNGRRI